MASVAVYQRGLRLLERQERKLASVPALPHELEEIPQPMQAGGYARPRDAVQHDADWRRDATLSANFPRRSSKQCYTTHSPSYFGRKKIYKLRKRMPPSGQVMETKRHSKIVFKSPVAGNQACMTPSTVSTIVPRVEAKNNEFTDFHPSTLFAQQCSCELPNNTNSWYRAPTLYYIDT